AFRDQLGTAKQQAGLWTAEQLVAAAYHHVRPGFQALRNQRLVSQARRTALAQGTAAQVIEEQNIALARQFGQRRQLWPLGEPDDLKIAGVDAEQGRGAGCDRLREILGARAVGGPDLTHL